MKIPPLSDQFKPLLITVTLPGSATLINDTQKELIEKAERDENQCFGFFPGMMREDSELEFDLPHAKALAEATPTLTVEGKKLNFNFVRLSLVKQTGDFPYHLDSDAATALTGDTSTISKRLVWRLLLNLSDKHPRTLGYLDADSSKVELEVTHGYIHCKDTALQKERAIAIAIPPRSDNTISGVLFCASRVLHTGQDDEHGHFVAGYGCEE